MHYPPELPILDPLIAGAKQRHRVTLPGAALSDEQRPVVTITGASPGPTLLVGAGVHGGEYPAIEAVIRLARELDPATLSGTIDPHAGAEPAGLLEPEHVRLPGRRRES